MKALSMGPVDRSAVAAVMARDEATAGRLLDDLLREGLCRPERLTIRLPN